MPEYPEYHAYYASDGSLMALYRDGLLIKAGTQDEVLAAAVEMLGIEKIYSDDFLLGRYPTAAENAALNLEEVQGFTDSLKSGKISELRRQAAKLNAEADELENGGE